MTKVDVSPFEFPVIAAIENGQGPTLIQRAQRIYARHAAGCCLHVVLDDGNTDDASVAVSVKAAFECEEAGEHLDCLNLAMCLRGMTEEQRDAFLDEFTNGPTP